MERQLRIQHFWVSGHILLLCNKIKTPSKSLKVAIKGVAMGGLPQQKATRLCKCTGISPA